MKKFFIILEFSLILFLLGCFNSNDNQSFKYGKNLSLDAIKSRGYMYIATEDNYAPFEMVIDNKPQGFSHDIVKELKKYAPFEIKQDILPWTGILASISYGKYDIAITGSIVSNERLLKFDFAPPIAVATHYAIIRSDNNTIKNISDLNGKKVGVQAGSVLRTRINELEVMLEKSKGKLGDIVEYTSYPDAYSDLENGRLDYVINTYIAAKNLIKQSKGKFKLSVPVSGMGFYAWPVPKGNDTVLQFFTDFIDYLYSSGKLYSLQEKWFGEKFVDLPRTPITSSKEYENIINNK